MQVSSTASDGEDFLQKHLKEVKIHVEGSDVEVAEHLVESPKRWQVALAFAAIAGFFWWLAPTIPFHP